MAVAIPAGDWQTERGVLTANKYMLEHELHTDIIFSLENAKGKFENAPAHKYVLISRSPVFYAMLCGPMAEKDEIVISDISLEVFKHLLSYIYYEEVALTPDIALPLIYAAKKYMVPALVEKCVKYLEDMLSSENVCSILEQSLLFDEDHLKQKCLRMIQTRSSHILKSDSFLKVTLETLETILDSPSLSASELDVFRASLRWAENQCKEQEIEPTPQNQREVLGEAIYKIHIPSIPLKDFSNHVTPSGILTVEESFNVFQFLAADEEHKPEEMKFPVVARSPAKIHGPLSCYFRFDSKLDGLYKKHSIVMVNIDRQVRRVEMGLSFLPQTAGCVGRIVIGQDNNTVTLPYDSQLEKVSADIDLYPGNFVIENYVTQMRFRVGLPKFAMLLTRVECCDGISLSVVASDAFSVLPAMLSLTVVDD